MNARKILVAEKSVACYNINLCLACDVQKVAYPCFIASLKVIEKIFIFKKIVIVLRI